MEEDQDQESRHVCKFCSKSFPCGRSLGGHMRSHNAETEGKFHCVVKQNGDTAYDLRENRKKTWRVSDSIDDKMCKECGKGFLSWKALFGHMKCHSDKERASVYNSDQDSWATSLIDTQSDNEDPNRRRRKTTRSNRTTTSTSSSLTFEQEQEEVAVSLMMLSRDMTPWGFQEMGSQKKPKRSELSASDQIPRTGFMKNKAKKLDSQSPMEYDDDSEEEDEERGKKNYKFNSHKKGKFQCTTCNKIFHSYQALGGHRASHKKITRTCLANSTSRDEESSENSIETDMLEHEQQGSRFDHDHGHQEAESKKRKGHECPICLKIFASGQALGGHKRSHLSGGSENTKDQNQRVREIRDFIDLNLPPDAASAEEESNNGGNGNNNSHSDQSYRSPWWVRGSHKQEPLLGLMSN